jgi:NADH-quinone oxidoreductase subunit F
LGTEAWRYVAHIARGEFQEAYQVIREANPFPSICARVCNHPCEDKCRAGTGGGQPVSIRALKRFVTDRLDPSAFSGRASPIDPALPPVAVVGAGPAGLTAAHALLRRGFRVTVFEAEDRPGGMLLSAIPPYRLPRDVVQREIDSLLDENITLKCRCRLGVEVTVDGLFEEGFKAVFLALGAQKSRRMEIPGEDAQGVYPSIHFLKTFNLGGVSIAKGRVGVIGGGNSAVDAARVALRQKDVSGVTIFYRRTRDEMPAFPEEVEAALQEGVRIRALVSPTEVLQRNGKLTSLRFVRNELGPTDETGRSRPVPVKDSEEEIPLDTLIVAISEGSDTDCIAVAGENRIAVTASGTVQADPETLVTSRPGVFAGGDVVTGPNTVVDAIAAGKRAAEAMAAYLIGEPLVGRDTRRLPSVYVAPPTAALEPLLPASRAETPRAPVEWRRRGFAEVEMSLSPEEAEREARRCLRCDLDFTRPSETSDAQAAHSGGNR